MASYIEKLEARIRSKLRDAGEDPFYLIDLETLCERHTAWLAALPPVRPYYAVKCNPNPAMLHTLERLGCGFDCASREEIDRVMEMGVTADRMIFANPCKLPSHIAHAKLRGVKRMTFDNEDELLKVAKIYPEAEMVLRIVTDDSHSMCQFSSKFGAHMESVRPLLELAAELRINVVGVSFHVGSGCADPASYAKALQDARRVFDIGREYGHELRLVDIGGGFQGTDDATPTLADIAPHVLPNLELFPPGTDFIAEPGRYFATKSHTLVVNIHSRRIIRDPASGAVLKQILYINEGVYHSFNCIFFDHQHPLPKVLPDIALDDPDGPPSSSVAKEKKVPTTVFGPTCDSLDCICKDFPMRLMEVGEWLYFTDMGAYTTAAMTRFNGFPGAITCHYSWGGAFIENVMGGLEQGELPGLPARVPSFVPVSTPSPEPATVAIAPEDMAALTAVVPPVGC